MAVWQFPDQIVVIVGGTGGLGQTLCRAFLDGGADVYACGHREEGIEKLRTEIAADPERSNRLHVEQVDVRDIPVLQSWLADIIREKGHIDVLINTAGICPLTDWDQVTEDMWDDVVNINMKSVFFACQAVMGRMMERGGGTIINVGSIAGYNGGIITTPAYGASKAGVHTLTKWLAAKCSPHGVRVNAVVPGPFETPMIADFPPEAVARMAGSSPDRRIGSPEDVAASILFLADREASGHITGAAVDVCGGLYLR